MIYLLAFDIDVVTKSLEKIQVSSGSGQNYLEKIVQVPFALPISDKVALRKLFFGKLNDILSGAEEEYFDISYWTNVYFSGIDHFIATPRDIFRLTNVLQATYPCLNGEVNSVDLIAIEAIRIFLPKLYDEIRYNQDLLTSMDLQQETKDKRKDNFEEWLGFLPEGDRISAKNLLSQIFPLFGSVYSGTICGYNWVATWRRQLRICSTDRFPIYFRFSLGPDSISNAEIKTLLKATGDMDAFKGALLRYASQTRSDGSSKVRAILERLEDYTREDILEQDIPSVVCTLLDIGDSLLLERDAPRGMFDFGNDIQISRVVHQLLMRLDEINRFFIVSKAIESGSAISTIAHEAAIWGQEHGKFGSSEPFPEKDRTFCANNLRAIERQVLQRIIKASEDGSLLSVPVPHLVGILYDWSTWAGTDKDVREWVDRIVRTDEGLVSFLQHFGSITRGQNAGDLAVRHKYRLDPEWMKPFTDPDKIAERLNKMDVNDLDQKQKKAVVRFLHEYDLRKRRDNPDIEPWKD